MSSRALKAVVGAAMAAGFSLAAAPAHAAPGNTFDPVVWNDLAETYMATGHYAYEPFAPAAGYTRNDTCAADKTRGGMGYHYINKAYLNSLDPATPAALVYEDRAGGTRRLVAVEWAVKDTGQAAPTLFGQTFRNDQKPGYYTLHAWIYKPNPEGLFAPYNPTVTCPA
ncbi:hypothetical protein [Streptomyces sp. HUAS ZL42]|uniref:hypothetical protein n=1 Tax=Streptomyces sp. HUAS ZL42 TaxID=3231715 RepID=UPI00345EE224